MKIAKISQNEEITASKIVKVAIFETLDLPQLISRKIVAVKFSNFHTVQSKLIHTMSHTDTYITDPLKGYYLWVTRRFYSWVSNRVEMGTFSYIFWIFSQNKAFFAIKIPKYFCTSYVERSANCWQKIERKWLSLPNEIVKKNDYNQHFQKCVGSYFRYDRYAM